MKIRFEKEEKLRGEIYCFLNRNLPQEEWDLWEKVHLSLCDVAKFYEKKGFEGFKH